MKSNFASTPAMHGAWVNSRFRARKLGTFDEAMRLIEQATTLEPRNTTLRYRQAVVCALTGDLEQAIQSLKLALDSGYSRAEAARNPDLECLHGKPEYEALFASRIAPAAVVGHRDNTAQSAMITPGSLSASTLPSAARTMIR